MKPELFIKRRQPDPDGLDFDGLRQEGIRLVQSLSGDIWTDYNLHDPGVTILEGLCYALTDLAHQSGFDVADYLSAPQNRIEFDKLALNGPDQIFSCRAATENDYRKLILGTVPNVDNVWIQKQAGDMAGLYSIYIQLNERVRNQYEPSVRRVYIEAVEKLYRANRNLCEDLVAAEITARADFSLNGNIEVDGRREPAALLAEIYYVCAEYFNPKICAFPFSDMYKQGMPLDELFSGILTKHGYIPDVELHAWRGDFSIPDLIGRILRIEGVRDVKRLVFVDDQGNDSEFIRLGQDLACRCVAALRFPSSQGFTVELQQNGKTYPISMIDVEAEFNRLNYNAESLRHRRENFDWVETLMPTGRYRAFSNYYSIQRQFPDIYGLNEHGVPDSESAQRKAQAAQLKAYLLLFEQLMANFLQNVQEIPRLFSVDGDLRQSYFHQVLRNDAVPEVEPLYAEGAERMNLKLASLVAQIDEYGERRNRVLDYLLALYGEQHDMATMSHFMEGGASFDDERIESKIAYLNDVADLGKNRAAGFDYSKSTDENRNASGLKKKLRTVLGLVSSDDALRRSGEKIQIVEHILLRPRNTAAYRGITVPGDFYNFRISVIFSSSGEQFANAEVRKWAEEMVYLHCPAHIDPAVLWLDAGDLAKFETLHHAWLETMRALSSDASKKDAAAAPLIEFLLAADKSK
jgi:hypothetical protein